MSVKRCILSGLIVQSLLWLVPADVNWDRLLGCGGGSSLIYGYLQQIKQIKVCFSKLILSSLITTSHPRPLILPPLLSWPRSEAIPELQISIRPCTVLTVLRGRRPGHPPSIDHSESLCLRQVLGLCVSQQFSKQGPLRLKEFLFLCYSSHNKDKRPNAEGDARIQLVSMKLEFIKEIHTNGKQCFFSSIPSYCFGK